VERNDNVVEHFNNGVCARTPPPTFDFLALFECLCGGMYIHFGGGSALKEDVLRFYGAVGYIFASGK
jgi:hypothetical protein